MRHVSVLLYVDIHLSSIVPSPEHVSVQRTKHAAACCVHNEAAVAEQVDAITWRPVSCNDTAFVLRASKNLYL
jgi:hypothetical protein